MQSERLRPYFLGVLLVAVFTLCVFILAPFLKPLLLAAIFAFVLQGLYVRISKLLRDSPSTAAFITVLVSVFFILVPLSLISILVGNEARSLYVSLENAGGQSTVAQFFLVADETFGDVIPGLSGFSRDISANIDVYTKEGLQWIGQHVGAIFSSVSSLLLSFFVFFVALFYLLRDGKRAKQALIGLSPLDDNENETVLRKLELAVNSVIKGNLTIAFIQGALTTLGFLVFGIPNAILWGTITAIAALIPGVGTALVFVPAIAFLFFTGATVQAFGLLAWGVLAVGLIDNFLGPKLIGQGMHVHPLLILLSVLGGIIFFGPVGVFFGPLSLSLFFAFLSIYVESKKHDRE